MWPQQYGTKVYNHTEVQRCLAGQWVHMDGDSLTRDQFYDTIDYLDVQPPCSRLKLHTDQTRRIPSLSLLVTHGFMNPAHNRPCDPPAWANLTGSPSRVPDVWVWSAGLWFFEASETIDTFRKRVECVAASKPAGTLGILRTTTPYAPKINDRSTCGRDCKEARNVLHGEQNSVAIEVLGGHGWLVLDAWNILWPRRFELTVEGIHYTGPGSKWVTNELMRMVCGL